MTNQPPEEIMTPPEGYEWTGECRVPKDGEAHAHWSVKGDWYAETRTGWKWPEPILRRIKPEYVNVRLPRDVVEHFATGQFWHATDRAVTAACREALEQE